VEICTIQQNGKQTSGNIMFKLFSLFRESDFLLMEQPFNVKRYGCIFVILLVFFSV